MDGGYAAHSDIPFPKGFVSLGVATSTIANTKASAPVKIMPEEPIIIGSIAFQMEDSQISAYDCEYLMEQPEAIAQYEFVYFVKCMFSEKDEAELAKIMAFSMPMEGYPPTENFSVAIMTEQKYIRISFQMKEELLHYYIYMDYGKYYIEQPYNGIREIQVDTLKKITSIIATKNSNIPSETSADVKLF